MEESFTTAQTQKKPIMQQKNNSVVNDEKTGKKEKTLLRLWTMGASYLM